MSTFSSDIGPEEEDGGGWGGLVPTKAEREQEKREQRTAARLAAAEQMAQALRDLLKRDQRNTCQHEETHRGGAIWEICDMCGEKWADDRGGKPKWRDPKEWDSADNALSAWEAAK